MGKKRGYRRCFVRKKGSRRNAEKEVDINTVCDTVPEPMDTVTDSCSDHTYFKQNQQEQDELVHVNVDSVTQPSTLLDHTYINPDYQEACNELNFETLKKECLKVTDCGSFSLLKTSKLIRYIQVCDNDYPFVKLCVTVDESLQLSIKVHNADLPVDHELWSVLPYKCSSVLEIQKVLKVIDSYTVCQGNSDEHLVGLVPQGAYLDVAREQNRAGYKDNTTGIPTIRSTACKFLVKSGRCSCCVTYRRTLSKALFRQKDRVATPKKNLLKSRMPISRLPETQQVEKIRQLRRYANSLENEVDKLQRRLKNIIRKDGLALNEWESCDMEKLMHKADSERKKSYPDSSSIQRLFWDQQSRYNKLVNKKCMRWHPMIIKWCIFLKSKSTSTYDSLRKSGFINLPSERTLHDYSHVLTKGVGFHEDVILQLQEEVSQLKEPHQHIVGLLQDEVKIRSDLVYDKYSGELIGFVDLDSIGNDLQNIQDYLRNENKPLAKYVLVVMVRGVSSRLKFPLAHFATNGVISDQLFSILWDAVEICEIDVGLTVLFITSDGASPNRRFIRLHRNAALPGDNLVFKAVNVFANEFRYIYFISDAPHLIKTTRNNFSNSYSHKKTNKLWKHGRDISWLHIVDLYRDHNAGLYRFCNKLTKSHVDLTAFSYMKVNLAAQVLSSTVANALEMLYGDNVKETVNFIRHMDKFFDLMNTRNFKESRSKRNTNLAPYQTPDDERLNYLTGDFLDYFKEWRESVENRPGDFTKSQKASMQLSYQTLEGIEITVRSVVECVKYCLGNGMPFVLTEKFNQDPIEQHFGIQRASCGGNTNPSLQEFSNTLQKLRTVGGQALAPLRGNTKRRLELQVDNTPLRKKPRQK